MIWITDSLNGNKVAINPDYILAVYCIPDGEHQGKTGINMLNGNIIANENDYDVVAMIGNKL